jgi:predicted transcriptional regulator of viral defense system
MQTKHKTIGPQMATLLASLYDADKRIFTVKDAVGIFNDRNPRLVSNMLRRAATKGVLTPLQSGVYTIVPPEMGSESEYVGDPYLAVTAILRGRPYYISHGSALSIHELTTQPWLKVIVSTTAALRPRTLHQTKYQFVKLPPERMYGTTSKWLQGSQRLIVSDIEKTIIDCLAEPQYCGGYSEVDKAAWIGRKKINVDTLVKYAIRLKRASVVSRLGFLLDSCKLGSDDHRALLKEYLPNAYTMLDPTLPAEGHFTSEWRLRVNIATEELAESRHT